MVPTACVQAEEDEEPEGRASSEEDSSDDDKSWVEEVREQRRMLRQENWLRRRQERKEADRDTVLLESEQNGKDVASGGAEGKKKSSQPQFYQIRAGEEFRSFNDMAHKQKLQKYVLWLFFSFFFHKCLTWTCEFDSSEAPSLREFFSPPRALQLSASETNRIVPAKTRRCPQDVFLRLNALKSISGNNGREVLSVRLPPGRLWRSG